MSFIIIFISEYCAIVLIGVCVSGQNLVYLAGGANRRINYRGPFSAEGVSSNLFVYDCTVGSWQVKAKMNHGRSQFSLLMTDGYVIFKQSKDCLFFTLVVT